jgi:DNA mismatch repair protein MutL
MSIRVLDALVAAKIAAGEVVERPASVVKELLDNAIDAGATQVRVETREGGLRLIRITDDGCGIADGDVELAFQRHATSKIATADDLNNVHTLGFRGEALYAIAAVAQVTMTTKMAADTMASSVRVENGQIVQRSRRGAPEGTAISVENLFAAVPARLKFLKSPASETGRMSDVVTQYALAHPGVKLSLICDGRLIFQSTGSGNLHDALVKVLGVDTAKGMIPVQGDEPSEEDEHSTGAGVRVTGYVSQPAITRASRSHLSFFINGRWVQNRMLSYAVEEAYHTLLQVGRHPIAVLNIELPPGQVDVNVHPAKSEVRFLREHEVFAAVQKAVRAALVQSSGIPMAAAYPHGASPATPARWMPPAAGPAPQQAALDLFRNVQPVQAPPVAGQPIVPVPARGEPASKLPPLRILGQAAQTYIIAESPEGIYLIDQHSAHERVVYEKLMADAQIQGVSGQGLLDPLTLDLTPRQALVIQRHLEQMRQMGFEIEPFGGTSVLIRSVPAFLPKSDITQAVRAILDDVADEAGSPEGWREALIVSITCHSAVRAGQSLSPQEMQELILQLEQTTLPRTCPHGRPTMILLSQAQLEREFGRR